MNDHFQVSLARNKLAEWEGLFKKYAEGRSAWADVYKEYFLIKQVRTFSRALYPYLCKFSHEYPLTHYYFCNVKESIEGGSSVYAPDGVQIAIYNLSRLSQQIRLYNLLEDKKSYIKLAGTLHCSTKVLRYYREAESAHKHFAEYLASESNGSMIIKASSLLSGVGSDPSSGHHDLIKFQKLELPIEYSLIKSVNHLIQKGESQTLEFKAAFIPNTTRQFDKKKLETQRLKEVVAFLNSEGGILLVGVDDDGSVHGVDCEIVEYYNSTIDKYGLSWLSLLKDRIAVSEKFGHDKKTGFITEAIVSHKHVSIDGKTIYMFSCKPSDNGAIFYLKDGNSYIYVERNNVSIKEIKDEDLERYLRLKRSCK